MRAHRSRALALALAIGLVLPAAACSDDGSDSSPSTTAGADGSDSTAAVVEPVIDPGDGGDHRPEIDPADFVAQVDNPYFPLVPGTRWVYEGTDDGETERIEVEVLTGTRTVMGIEATVVRDRVSVDGSVVEDTFDWFAQDAEGSVWYLGEDSKEIEDGEVVSTDGSWEAGVDGALPGIVMPGDPTPGDAYRQEYFAGEAEDLAEVVEAPASVEVAGHTYTDLVRTREWNPLEPEVVEEKTYAPGVGVVVEAKVEGGEGLVELVEVVAGR